MVNDKFNINSCWRELLMDDVLCIYRSVIRSILGIVNVLVTIHCLLLWPTISIKTGLSYMERLVSWSSIY